MQLMKEEKQQIIDKQDNPKKTLMRHSPQEAKVDPFQVVGGAWHQPPVLGAAGELTEGVGARWAAGTGISMRGRENNGNINCLNQAEPNAFICRGALSHLQDGSLYWSEPGSGANLQEPLHDQVIQAVSLPHCQTVRLSDCQTVRLSDCQTVRLSDCHTVRLSDCQTVRLSGNQMV